MTATTWNPSDAAAQATFSNGNLTADLSTGSETGVRATNPLLDGQMCEFTYTPNVSFFLTAIGLSNLSWGLTNNYVGNDSNGIGYVSTGGLGRIDQNNTTWTSPGSLNYGDIIRFGIKSGKFYASLNGSYVGGCDAAAETGGLSITVSGALYPTGWGHVNTQQWTINPSGASSPYADWAGFTWMDTAGTTVALTGQAVTASRGSFGVTATVPLTGQAVTASRGTLTPTGATVVSLVGQSVTASGGSFTPTLSLSLTGQSSTASKGALLATTAIALTGRAVTASGGALASSAAVTLLGQSLTVSRGVLDPSPVTIVALTGRSVTASAGSLGVTFGVGLSGLTTTASAGTISPPIVVPPVRRIRTGPVYRGLGRSPPGALPRSPVRYN